MNQDEWMKDDLLRSAEAQGFPAIDPDAIGQRGRRMRRNRTIVGGALGLGVVAVAAAILLPLLPVQPESVLAVPAGNPTPANTPTANPTPGTPTPSEQEAFPIGEWARTADSGLPQDLDDPRITWVGGEYLVLGGSIEDDADQEWIPANVAKAFNPAENTWRDIAQPPYDLGGPLSGEPAVVGNTVYLAGDAYNGDGACEEPYFISYNLDTDTWTELERPAGKLCTINEYGLYAVGERIVVLAENWIHGNPKNGTQPDRVYDTVAKQWSDLPEDPVHVATDEVYSRQAYVDGDQLAVVHFNDYGAEESIGAVSYLDPASGTWNAPAESRITGIGTGQENWPLGCEDVLRNGLITCTETTPYGKAGEPYPDTWKWMIYAFRLVPGTAQAEAVIAAEYPFRGGLSYVSAVTVGDYAATHGHIVSNAGEVIHVPAFPSESGETVNRDANPAPTPTGYVGAPDSSTVGVSSALGYLEGGKFYLFRYA